jgi:hypothetical protein
LLLIIFPLNPLDLINNNVEEAAASYLLTLEGRCELRDREMIASPYRLLWVTGLIRHQPPHREKSCHDSISIPAALGNRPYQTSTAPYGKAHGLPRANRAYHNTLIYAIWLGVCCKAPAFTFHRQKITGMEVFQ